MWTHVSDRISFWSLYFTVILMPIFIIPFFSIPIEVGKSFLLVIGLLISLIFYLNARFSDGKILIPKSHILFAGLLLAIVTIISALASHSINVSMFGIMLENTTALFLALGFLLMLMTSIVFNDHKKVKSLLKGILFSFSFLYLFQVLYIIVPKFFSLGIFSAITDNLLGSWNSFGIISGLTLIGSLFILEFFNLKNNNKVLLYFLYAVSIFFVILVNFPLIWKIAGIFSLFIFIYKITIHSSEDKDSSHFIFPYLSFATVMICLLFIMSGQFIGGYLPGFFKTTNVEVSPTTSITATIAKKSLLNNPVFGIGPSKFNEIWSLYKPLEINATQFWDSNFNYGNGYIPTMAITTGILGIIFWCIFLVLFFVFGFKILSKGRSEDAKWETPLFFIMSAYLLVFSIFYSSSSSLILLAFAFLGIFIGLHSSGIKSNIIQISFLKNMKKSMIYITILVASMLFSAGMLFKYIERFASVNSFRKTLSATNIDQAEISINNALSLYDNDLYYRTFTQFNIVKLSNIISKGDKMTEEERSSIKDIFENALLSAQSAINYNNKNYLNYISLADVYSTAISIGATGAQDKAIEALNSAIALNPNNPQLHLSIAQIYLGQGKFNESKQKALFALNLKNNYLNTYIVLSQIESNTGNNVEALNYAKQALALAPNNKDLIKYVESLNQNSYYNSEPINVEPTSSENNTTNTSSNENKSKKKN